MSSPNRIVPLNPRTGLPYADGRAISPSGADRPAELGVVNAKGEVVRHYDIPWADAQDLLKSGTTTLKAVDAWSRTQPRAPQIVFTDRKGIPVLTPRPGQQGRWAVRDAAGDLWLLQPPELTPPLPGRSRGKDAEGKRVRGDSPGPARITAYQRFSRSAQAFMQKSLSGDPQQSITMLVNTRGQVAGPNARTHQVAYRLDRFGRDTRLHEKLGWTQFWPYELALLLRPGKRIDEGEWTPWHPLDADKSVRESIGRLAASVSEESLERLRSDPATFISLRWEANVADAGGVWPMSGRVDLRKDAEMIVKSVARDICQAMFRQGMVWSRMRKEKKGEGVNPTRKVKVFPDERGKKFLQKITGKVIMTERSVPIGKLDHPLAGKVRFKLDIKVLGGASVARSSRARRRRLR